MVGFLFFPGQLQQVIGRFLIDHIDPIGVKQVSIAAPLEAGLLTAVIVGIVKFRLLRVKALVFVTDEFILQGISVIFKMAHDKDMAHVARTADVDAVFGAAAQHFKARVSVDLIVIDTGITRLGNEVAVIKAAQERMEVCRKSIGIDAVEPFWGA